MICLTRDVLAGNEIPMLSFYGIHCSIDSWLPKLQFDENLPAHPSKLDKVMFTSAGITHASFAAISSHSLIGVKAIF